MIGTRISHYDIVDKLGAGGMGEVYLAQDLALKRSVALKVLPADFAADPERLARFRREAESLAALDHPNIVTVFSIEQVGDLHILTMERVAGRPLDRAIPAGGMPLPQLLEIGVALSSALRAAHAMGITHRDLKPANLMWTEDGRLKVLDFGLAKLRGQPAGNTTLDVALTRESAIVGTVPYMSPEQVTGAEVDGRSDLFSFGIVMFELATGRRPFAGESLPEVMRAILGAEPPALGRLRPDLPPELGRVLERCLRKQPEQRHASALELHGELLALRDGGAAGRRTVASRMPAGRMAVIAAVVGLAGLVAWLLAAGGGGTREDVRVVLIPFGNGGAAEDAWFAAAMESGIAEHLGTIERLIVCRPPRNWQDLPAAELCEKIGAAFALSAKVFRYDEGGVSQVLITPELSRADGSVLALSSVDRPMPTSSDQQAAQRAIADQVVQRIGIARGGRLTSSGVLPTRNEEALKQFQIGRFLFGKRDEASLQQAEECFRRAAELDPDFLLPRQAIGSIATTRAWYCLVAPKAAWPIGVAATRTVLAADEDNPEALADLAGSYQAEGDWPRAEQAFRRSIECSRRYPGGLPVAHQWFSLMLAWRGRHAEALEQITTATRLDPTSSIINTWVGLIHYCAGRHGEAMAALDHALTLDSNFLPACWHGTWIAAAAGQPDRAVRLARKALELAPGNPLFTVNLAWAEAVAGHRDEAIALLPKVAEFQQQRYVSQYQLAAVHAALGDPDEAFRCLDRAVEDRADWRGGLQVDHRFDSLRGDPRFAETCAKIGL